MNNRIKYQKGFKYQIKETSSVHTKIIGYKIEDKFYSLKEDGELIAMVGYSFDGASGFPDIKSIIRGSLFHDIGYQALRSEELPREMKEPIDRLLQELCVRDGMWKWMAWCVYKAVNVFGKGAAHPNHKRQVFTAP